ncbi:tRNA ligase [Rhizophlyctis rosea]|nr:tRNA ligase [Rhizophlyctis rosea]
MDKSKKARQQTLTSFFSSNAAGKKPSRAAQDASADEKDNSSPPSSTPPPPGKSNGTSKRKRTEPNDEAQSPKKSPTDEKIAAMEVEHNDSNDGAVEKRSKKKAGSRRTDESGSEKEEAPKAKRRLVKKGDALAKSAEEAKSKPQAEKVKPSSPRKRKSAATDEVNAMDSPPPKKRLSRKNSESSGTEVDESPSNERPRSPGKKKTKAVAQPDGADAAKKVSAVKGKKSAKVVTSSREGTPEKGSPSPPASEPSEFEKDDKAAVAEEKDQEEEEKEIKTLAKATAKMIGDGFAKAAPGLDWKKGADVPYAALCKTFEDIESTTKRLQITAYLTNFFKRVMERSPHNLVACVYLCLNRIGPEYEGKELGIGESILIKAIAEATARSAANIKADLAETGDLGTIAQSSKGRQKSLFAAPPLTVPSVFKTLKEIAAITGTASQSKKIKLITKMLSACKGNEPKFLIRSLEGKLRIGVAERTVLPALANASVAIQPGFDKWSTAKREAELEEAASTIKQVYSELPTYDEIIPVLLEKGTKGLEESCKLRPGVPLKPMLAHPTKAISEVLDRFENMTFTCEYKYDGERAQIHMLEDGTVMIYSRNSENLSAKYPDVIERLHKIPKEGIKSFVLDAECVAWDREQKCILPFQVLSTRKRKALTQDPLIKRRALLHSSFNEVEGEFSFAKYSDGATIEEIQSFLDEAVAGNCEGLMVKTLEKEASYEPSKRSRNWLKVKKDYLSGAGDSLDLVVIGGYAGKGKRTGWYGGYLLACYNEEAEEYQSICKIGTGFSEEQLAEHAKFFKDHIIDRPRPYYRYTDTPNLRPDVWFEPCQVWEVKAADLSISPVHHAAMGLVDNNKGISLRFPRFIRVRDDKSPEDATNAAQVADFYRAQKINTAGKVDDDDD